MLHLFKYVCDFSLFSSFKDLLRGLRVNDYYSLSAKDMHLQH